MSRKSPPSSESERKKKTALIDVYYKESFHQEDKTQINYKIKTNILNAFFLESPKIFLPKNLTEILILLFSSSVYFSWPIEAYARYINNIKYILCCVWTN